MTSIPHNVVRAVNQIELHPYFLNEAVHEYATTPARIRENFGLSDFALEAADREAIDALDRGEADRIGAHADAVAYVPA